MTRGQLVMHVTALMALLLWFLFLALVWDPVRRTPPTGLRYEFMLAAIVAAVGIVWKFRQYRRAHIWKKKGEDHMALPDRGL